MRLVVSNLRIVLFRCCDEGPEIFTPFQNLRKLIWQPPNEKANAWSGGAPRRYRSENLQISPIAEVEKQWGNRSDLERVRA